MLARVSNIEALRRWRHWRPLYEGQEEPTVDDLVRFITADDPTPAMLAGTAFHKAMELAGEGDHEALEANGYTFHLSAGSIALPDTRELRAYGEYGGLTVTGQVDCLSGKTVQDHKTTSRFDAERYLDGCQWRFYLDLFGADVFQWNVFEIRELEPLVYHVGAPQTLRAYRYPALHDDCAKLAADYLEFASQHLPERQAAA